MKTKACFYLFSVFALCSCAMSGAKDTSARTPQSDEGSSAILGIVGGEHENSNLFNIYEMSLSIKGDGVTSNSYAMVVGVNVILRLPETEITVPNVVHNSYYSGDGGDSGAHYQTPHSGRHNNTNNTGREHSRVIQVSQNEFKGTFKISASKIMDTGGTTILNSDVYLDIIPRSYGGYYYRPSTDISVRKKMKKVGPNQWESQGSPSDFNFVLTMKKL